MAVSWRWQGVAVVVAAFLLTPLTQCNAASATANEARRLRRGGTGVLAAGDPAPYDVTLPTSTKPPPPPVPNPLGYGDLRLNGLGVLPTPTPMPPPPPPDPPIPPLPLPDMAEVGMDRLWEMNMPKGVVGGNYTLDYLGNRVDKRKKKKK